MIEIALGALAAVGLMTAHAEALAEDGGPRSRATGRELIATYDAMAGP